MTPDCLFHNWAKPNRTNVNNHAHTHRDANWPLALRDSLVSSQSFSKSSSSSSLMIAWTVSFSAHALCRIWRSEEIQTFTLQSAYVWALVFHWSFSYPWCVCMCVSVVHCVYLRDPCLGCIRGHSARWDPRPEGTLWLFHTDGGLSWRGLLTGP